jgi:hypothetical protein
MDRWLHFGPVALVGVFVFPVALVLVTQHGGVRLCGWILLAFCLLVLVLCLEPVRRRLPWKFVSRRELTAEFWERAFEALPFPAFVKEFPHDRHVKDNRALAQFQGKKPGAQLAGVDLAALIQQDHQQGDSLAEQEGFSVQLELTDKVTTVRPRPILTFKSCIEYDHRKYIVGSYVPVILPPVLPSGTSFEAAGCGGQVLFRCPEPSRAADGNILVVTMGNSLQVPPAASEQ